MIKDEGQALLSGMVTGALLAMARDDNPILRDVQAAHDDDGDLCLAETRVALKHQDGSLTWYVVSVEPEIQTDDESADEPDEPQIDEGEERKLLAHDCDGRPVYEGDRIEFVKPIMFADCRIKVGTVGWVADGCLHGRGDTRYPGFVVHGISPGALDWRDPKSGFAAWTFNDAARVRDMVRLRP